MGSPSSDPRPAGENGRRAASRQDGPAEVSGRDFLRGVLEKTLTLCSSDEPLDGENRQALRAVVDRHRGKPFAVEPVAVELVEAVLHTEEQRKKGGSGKAWKAVSRQVAETLCEDPSARQRLEAFWVRLGGGG